MAPRQDEGPASGLCARERCGVHPKRSPCQSVRSRRGRGVCAPRAFDGKPVRGGHVANATSQPWTRLPGSKQGVGWHARVGSRLWPRPRHNRRATHVHGYLESQGHDGGLEVQRRWSSPWRAKGNAPGLLGIGPRAHARALGSQGRDMALLSELGTAAWG